MSEKKRYKKDDQKPDIDLSKIFDKLPPNAYEAECALLGSMILDSQVIGDVVQIMSGEKDFYKASHGVIYKTLVDLYDKAEPVDLVHLKQRLDDQSQLDGIGGIEYLVELVEAVPSALSAPYYAKIVNDKAILRGLIGSATDILHKAYHTAEPVDNQVDIAEQAIFNLRQNGNSNEATLLKLLLEDALDRIDTHDGRSITGVETGYYEFDEMTSGLQPGEMIILAARPSMGKAQPLDAKVLTPNGYVRMGDLQIGDALASIDGKPSQVVGIFPQGQKQIFRFTLSDGRSAECCDEHLWQVHYRQWDKPRVLSTKRIREMLTRKRYVNRLWVEPFSGQFGMQNQLPIDPWLLGMLIGDGNIKGSAVRFSSADTQTIERVEQTVGCMGLKIKPIGGYDYRIVQVADHRRPGHIGVHPNPLKELLVELKLWDCGADQKFIPSMVFESDYQTRRELLAGLIASDGWVETWGSIRFGTASRQLADDVIKLMRSLGGSGSWTRKRTTYTYAGVKREGLPAYVCNLQHPDPDSLGIEGDKGQRLVSGRVRQRRLNITSIEPTRITEAQCIAVSHPTHLYITDDYIVTHNTALALNIAEHIGVVNKQPVAVFSLEMGKAQLAERLMASNSGVDSQKIRKRMLSGDDFMRLQESCASLSDAPLYIDDTPGLSILALRAKARRLAARYGIKAIMIDYLQLMSDPGSESRQQEVSNISRNVKGLARDLNVPVVCLSQLNRGAENREGHRPRMADLRESGSIEQDADVVMMLHREEYYHNGDEEWKQAHPELVGTAEIIIAKQRNGPTGSVHLQFHGATTRFNNLSHAAVPGGGVSAF